MSAHRSAYRHAYSNNAHHTYTHTMTLIFINQITIAFLPRQEDHPHNSFRVTVHQSTDAVFNGACKVTFLDHKEFEGTRSIITHQWVNGLPMHATYDRVDGASKHVEAGSGLL